MTPTEINATAQTNPDAVAEGWERLLKDWLDLSHALLHPEGERHFLAAAQACFDRWCHK